MRLMGDATHSNVSKLPKTLPIVAGYDTGSPDIKWTDADWAEFPKSEHVHIDQGGNGSPVYSATVQDVEPGAYSPDQVPGWQDKCTAPRPTVYCDRNTLPLVLNTGWRGDLWLAIPEPEPTLPPIVDGCTVVGVQFKFAGVDDISVIFDPYWPALPPKHHNGHKRVIATGLETVGAIAAREGMTVANLLVETILMKMQINPHGLSASEVALLDAVSKVRPRPGTVLWT